MFSLESQIAPRKSKNVFYVNVFGAKIREEGKVVALTACIKSHTQKRHVLSRTYHSDRVNFLLP